MRLATGLVAVLSLFVVAGCGESDKEKLQADVNAICEDLDNDTKALQKANDLKSIAREGRKAIPAITRAETRFKEVKGSEEATKDFGDDYTAFVATVLETSTRFGQLIVAAEQGDKDTANRLLREIDRLDKKGDRQAEKLGFDKCAGD
jgi:hypothetical protein